MALCNQFYNTRIIKKGYAEKYYTALLPQNN